jgi:putative nucleotidyltransferase with HDIG domain
LGYQGLPEDVLRLLTSLNASPRLVAHLTLVYTTAVALVTAVDASWPTLVYDRQAVLFGAATHDIGKTQHPNELSQAGHEHESAGEALLHERGYPAALARFARTHGQWLVVADAQLEDLLVALADALWRGKRDERLETQVCRHIAEQTGQPIWQVFATLDDIATEISTDADARLAWQNSHAVAHHL